MTMLFERTISHAGREYRIIADFDDALLMEDTFRIAVRAAVRTPPDEGWQEETVEIAVNLRLSYAQVLIRGQEIATVPLDLPLDDVSDFSGNGLDIPKDDVTIEDALGASGVERLIHLVPADPFLGCIVKSAVSTLIGQTIRCWRSVPRSESFRQMIGDTGSCLREYGLRMTMVFMYRAGRCAVLGGWS